VAAGHSVDLARWQELFEELLGRVAGRFGRVEPRRRAKAFVCGLLADLPRKNCWTIAEHAGDPSPDGMQHLLARAVWDEDMVRDDLRDYVVEHLGDPGAVLVIDETGDLKKGSQSVGVQRQYTGTAGRIENAQVAVYLVYASEAGHAMIDRELYVPRGWIADPDRCRAAGIPAQVGFATKPALVTRMLARTLDADVPAAWVTGDEVYGADPGLRSELERRGIGYVLAVACDHRVLAGGDSYRADAFSDEFRREPGSACPLGAAPRATVCTTGPSSAWTTATQYLRARRASAGCWPAATARPASCLLLLLDPTPGLPGHPGPDRRTPLDHRGALPDRQGPVWP
jgi:SRSO17 transposase